MSGPAVGLIIVAAGSGRRMGGIDKVWAPLRGHPLVWHSLRNLAPRVDQTVLVVRAADIARAQAELAPDFPGLIVVPGGAERQDSVRYGLAALGSVEIVAVHDAARPFATPALLAQGVSLVQRYNGAIPGLPVTDTIKQVNEEGIIIGTIDRAPLQAVQTPQIFRRDILQTAHEAADSGATDDATLVERSRGRVIVFPGEARNIKITTPFDLRVAEFLSEEQPA